MTRNRTFANVLLSVAGGLGLVSYAKGGDIATMVFATAILIAGLAIKVRSRRRV